VLNFIAILGTGVAVYAGFCAYTQNDIKKILAYSTLSQLGYASAAFGFGAPGIALFHLITHAFFKALLFLGAGSVIHGCHHEQNIFKMGGLFKRMPVTSITFLIGMLSLFGVYLGVFGFAGFYSKDAILIAAGFDHPWLFKLLITGAFLTAGYMGRLYWVAFLGEPNSEAASNARENSIVMLVPLVILAFLSIAGGWTEFWPQGLGGIIQDNILSQEAHEHYDHLHHTVLIWGSAAWIVGLLGSLFFYGRGAKKDHLEQRAKPLYALLKSRLLIDELYNFYVAKIQQRFAMLLGFLDVFLIKGVFVRGSAGIVGLVGACSRMLHVGNIHAYVYWFLAGLILFWVLATGTRF
jgi:NADH-quinone oxidoreductase subunit L